jgi:hypothetical protein
VTNRRPLTLPRYTPTTWELRLPDYPVITGAWRSSAFPEILGSLPSGAEWSLTFENVNDAQALALLLPWRATAGGLWPLTALPAELASGVNSDDFKKRLTGTTWTIAREPRKESIKNGRFNVTIDLVYELTLESSYGPKASATTINESPLLLNISQTMTVVGIPTDKGPPINRIHVGPVLNLELVSTMNTFGVVVGIDKGARIDVSSQSELLSLNISQQMSVIAIPTSINKPTVSMSAQSLLITGLPAGMDVVAAVP